MLHFHFKTFRLSRYAKVYSTELLIKHPNFNSVTQKVYNSHILINFHEWCILYLSYNCESSHKNKNRITFFFFFFFGNQAIGTYSLNCFHDKSLQLCLTLCNSINCSLPGSSVHGISRQQYCSGLPFPSPGFSLTQGVNPHVLYLLPWKMFFFFFF